MAKELLTIRCPDDLIQLIQKQVDLTGLDRTSVVVGMLSHSLPSVLVAERSKLPNIPAIYLVWTYNRLLYIGKTDSLKQRWVSHHRIVQFIEAGDDCKISWFEFNPDDANNLPALESSLIDLLDPEYNYTKSPLELRKTRVFTYMPENLHKLFVEFREKRGLPSDSQALIAIISEYFNYNGEVKQQPEDFTKRLTEVEGKLAELAALFNASSVGIEYNILDELPTTIPNSGLSQRQLAKRLICGMETLQKYRESSSKLLEWSKKRDPNGLAWEFKGGKYHPINND